MRLGISSSLSHRSPEEWAEKHKALGCGTVVFPANCMQSDSVILGYKDAADKAGLSIAEVGVWTNPVSEDPATAKKNLEYCINQLKLAEEVGARCCVNVAGAVAGDRWDGGCAQNFTEDAWKRIVESVQIIIDAVKPKNTFYSLEPMPWMYPTGPDEYLKLLKDVGRKEFAVHMDLVNMINCPDRYFFADSFMEDCFAKIGTQIKSCHIKDILLLQPFTFQLKECGCGEGTLNLEKYAELATKADPDMPMIIEHLSSEDDYINSMAYVKDRLAKYL